MKIKTNTSISRLFCSSEQKWISYWSMTSWILLGGDTTNTTVFSLLEHLVTSTTGVDGAEIEKIDIHGMKKNWSFVEEMDYIYIMMIDRIEIQIYRIFTIQ